MKRWWLTAMVAAIAALPAAAQDSTSTDPAIGDAVFYNDTTEQVNRYIVDTVPLTTSWGNTFRVAPIVKSSKVGYSYLGSLVSAQGISNTLLDASFPAASYDLWNAPQYGVNALWNLPGTPVNTVGLTGKQFGATFAEFSRNDAMTNDISSIITAVVNYRTEDPTRLYVTRINAATNGTNEFESTASFGIGSVDSHGNTYFRADNFGTLGPDPLLGNNLYRVEAQNRNPSILNVLNLFGPGDAAATDWLRVGTSGDATHNTPNNIPQQVAGRGVLLGSNFNSQYVYEAVANSLTYIATHKAAGVTDHRGAVAFSHRLACGSGAVGTAGILGVVGGSTTALNLWSVDANGAIVGAPYALIEPGTFALPGGGTFGPNAKFDHYHSQTAFRGGNSQVAIGKDPQSGKGLAAGTLYDFTADPSTTTNPFNAIAVARFDCGGVNLQWTLAAWVDEVAEPDIWDGTPIYDGNDVVIGRLAPLFTIVNLSRRGPSISAPAFDAAGNVWFIACFERYGDPYPYNTGLLRAVYDSATFTYKLELVLEYYQVFHGANSDTDYQIRYLALADGGSGPSVDSGTLWSGNVMQAAVNGVDPATLAAEDPQTLGGLVIQAGIVYDINGDGLFEEVLGTDEEYNVLLFVSGEAGGPAACPGDTNCDGVVGFGDINPFVAGLTGGPQCNPANFDINGNGTIGFDDINPFVALLSAGGGPCP